jgi:Cu(I)/Ag(I) efflux system membrane protein CusA/SilA
VRETLVEEALIVALICVVFLLHARSALVAVVTLPISVLIAFIGLRAFGIGADIMSLGGIAIAIGEMIDAAIVMVENMHKHLERRAPPARCVIDTATLSTQERWDRWHRAREVGPSLFYSLLIITVSFIPVFTLEGRKAGSSSRSRSPRRLRWRRRAC